MISIITPTFNRGMYLEKIYTSLLSQTSTNFEWIIVDDGSIDNTEKIVKNYLECQKFKVYYFKQENGGRHRALNNGVQHSNGSFCLFLDSDDYLLENAVELLEEWTNNLDHNIAGVSGLKIFNNGECTCDVSFSDEFFDLENYKRNKIGLNGDCCEVYKKDVLLHFPFAEFEGEKFLSESSCWNKIAQFGYKIRWYFKPIYVCQYLDNGLSKNILKKLVENPEGAFYTSRINLNCYNLFDRIREIGFISFLMRDLGYKYIGKKLKRSRLKCSILSKLYKYKHRKEYNE